MRYLNFLQCCNHFFRIFDIKVVAISRGKSKPYINDPAWKMVEQVVLDRNKDEDFAYKVAKMNADIVVDLINFKPSLH